MCVPGPFPGVSDCMYLGRSPWIFAFSKNQVISAAAYILRITLWETRQLGFLYWSPSLYLSHLLYLCDPLLDCQCGGECVLVAQSCLAFCDSVDGSQPGSSLHGILQARILVVVRGGYLVCGLTF